MAEVDSSKATSEELRKQIGEQTSFLAEADSPDAPPGPETIELAEGKEEPETPEEPTEGETPEGETTEATPKEGDKGKLFKLKVEGKEEWVPEEKVIEYAQKGRFLEKERQKQKEQLEQVRKAQPPAEIPFDRKKINEEFVSKLQDDTFGTMLEFVSTFNQQNKQQEIAEKRQEREFMRDREETVPHWKDMKPLYDELRDLGRDRDTAFAMAEADYFKSLYLSNYQKAIAEGEKRAKLKKKVEIPIGEKKGAGIKTGLPSDKDLSKMTSEEIAKHLKFTRNPGY
jgi:hypothetical protein